SDHRQGGAYSPRRRDRVRPGSRPRPRLYRERRGRRRHRQGRRRRTFYGIRAAGVVGSGKRPRARGGWFHDLRERAAESTHSRPSGAPRSVIPRLILCVLAALAVGMVWTLVDSSAQQPADRADSAPSAEAPSAEQTPAAPLDPAAWGSDHVGKPLL